jgi:hypothetical protein
MLMRYVAASAILLATLALPFTPAARATVVNPGETTSAVNVDGNDYAPPTGDIVAQNSQDFTIDYDLTGTGFSPSGPTSFAATLTSSVVRDPATQRLTFVYHWAAGEEGQSFSVGSERNTFAVESFAGFTTDMSIATAGSNWIVTRSADGATISADSVDVGGSTVPDFFISTDAIAFDANGTFSGTAGTELSVIRDEDQVLTSFSPQSTTFKITGTFQPIADDGSGGGGGGGRAIPLPASAWTGLAGLAIAAVVAARINARRALRLV